MARLDKLIDALGEKNGKTRPPLGTLQVDVSGIGDIKDTLSGVMDTLSTLPMGILARLDGVEGAVHSKTVDLAPVTEAIQELKDHVNALVTAVQNIKIETPKEEMKDWTFDIKRNRAGYIKSIDAKCKT